MTPCTQTARRGFVGAMVVHCSVALLSAKGLLSMTRRSWLSSIVLGGFCIGLTSLISCEAGDKKDDAKTVTTDSGLKYQELKVGDGQEAKKGDTVAVHYTGWLTNG